MLHPSYEKIKKLYQEYAPSNKNVIIDYGCGNGRLLDLLEEDSISRYIGFEVSEAALLEATRQYGKRKNVQLIHFKPGCVPNLGNPNSTDVIILIGVLQYMTVEEIVDFILKAKQVLKPGGYILASCVVDHSLYKFTNAYALFFPNYYVNRSWLIHQLISTGFRIEHEQERGIIIGPLFSHGLIIIFDALDKLLFRNKGKLGPIGTWVRHLFFPLLRWENKLPIDYGYTFFIAAKKT